jgi:hypothetical protein
MNTYKHINGITSSFLPGEKGKKGRRSRVTFIASYSEGQFISEHTLEQYQLTGEDDYTHDNDRTIGNIVGKLSYKYIGDANYPLYNKDVSYPPTTNTKYTSENQYTYQQQVINPPIGQHDSSNENPYVPINANDYKNTSEALTASNEYWSELDKLPFDISTNGEPSKTDINPSDYRYKADTLPLGNIIKEDSITSLPLSDAEFVEYKFYEISQLDTDISTGYIATIPNSYMSLIIPGFDSAPKITRNLPEYPEEYDYIIYIDRNKTYLLVIEEVSENFFYEPIVCKCKILDTWSKSKDIATHINNTTDLTHNIKMYCVNQHIKRIILDDDANKKSGHYYSGSGIGSRDDEIKYGYEDHVHSYTKPVVKVKKDSTLLKNFILTSTSGVIGQYKITAEFFYKEPITLVVHSTVAERFVKDKIKGDNVTIIGNSCTYTRDNSGYTDMRFVQNFDDERLDTFEITIKDFDDGVDTVAYTPSINFYIPDSRKDSYDVNIFMYYKKLNGGYNKFLINNMPYREFIAWDDLINNKHN